MHDKLWKILRILDTDYEPYGNADREGSDCSCGCRRFVKLAGDVGNDWGVCSNPESPRSGLLTFEHQGCAAFEKSDILATERPNKLDNLTPRQVFNPECDESAETDLKEEMKAEWEKDWEHL